jgi:ferrous iron transport protein B
LEDAISQLVRQIEFAFPGLPNTRWVALRLLDGDESIERAVRDGTLGQLTQTLPPQTAPAIRLELEAVN